MRAAVRTLVTLCVVALAVWAGYQLWQYYMLTPWTRDARVRADVVVIALTCPVGYVSSRPVITSRSRLATC